MKNLLWARQAASAGLPLWSTLILLASAPNLSAGLLPGNLWPNPTLELDAANDGVPDF